MNDDRKQRPLDWSNIWLLALVHAVAIGGGAIYLLAHGLSLSALIIGLVLTTLTIFSISAGYHRLFSHRAYEAHPVFRFFLLAFGAGAFQTSALTWAAAHRRHHARTDTELDPYNARRGFWYAHVGWVVRKEDPNIKPVAVPDLQRDPLVAWQHRHSTLIGTVVGIVLPTVLGLAFGDPWGGFIVGGAVRLFFVYHATFAINSFAHFFGVQPYSDENSARDSLLTALISMGEGYHNFHHTFPADYRNGVLSHQFDPTKWVLRTLAAVRVATNLRRTPLQSIVRARLRMDQRSLEAVVVLPAARLRLQQLRDAVDQAVARWQNLVAQYETAKRDATDRAREMLASRRREIRAARRALREAYAHWKLVVRFPATAALGC